MRPSFSFPEWGGEPVKSLLLFPEQGNLDQIKFARYAALLKARGVQATMIAPAPLASLFETLGVEVIVGGEGVAVPRRGAWAPVGSLPRWLGEHAPDSYFAVAPAAEGKLGVTGVITRGNPAFARDDHRSLPPEFSAELMALLGAVSLQVDTGAADFLATARLIAGLDRVIASDTAITNLAVAIGNPTWVLLSHDPDWRWGWSGDTTAWYPTARLFRQSSPGDWRTVMDAVKAALSPSSPASRREEAGNAYRFGSGSGPGSGGFTSATFSVIETRS